MLKRLWNKILLRPVIPITILLLAVVLFIITISATINQKEITKDDKTQEDMQYGATMREDKKSYKLPMTYDKRFVKTNELAAAANFFFALQNNDENLFKTAVPSFYEGYLQESTGNKLNIKAGMTQLRSVFENKVGTDFTIEMIEITAYDKGTHKNNFDTIVSFMKEASLKSDGTDIIPNIKSVHGMTASCRIGAVTVDFEIYAVEIGDAVYIVNL
jgi:hypothetical protein